MTDAAPIDDGYEFLPFYLVVDVSMSMSGPRIDQVNQILPQMAMTLERDPILVDKVRFGAIDFSGDARVVLPLCDLTTVGSLPTFQERDRTSYAAAFELLRTQIQADVDQLKADGCKVFRPTVFFMSDGDPTEDEAVWRAAFTDLITFDKDTKQGFAYYPNVIPFGIVGASPQVLQQLIHPSTGERPMKMFLTDQGADAAASIGAMAEILIASVVSSAASVANGDFGGPVVDVPLPDGVRSVPADPSPYI